MYVFAICRSPEECADWSKLILDTVNAHKSDQEENTGYIAPVWTPDSDCTQCELCAVQFTVIQRRHHCRNCGAVVCDSCSKKRFLVAHINQNKESRVCDPCYVDLTETRTDNAEESNREHQACPGDESSKSNLPRRGRQSVILRGIDVEEMSNSPVKKSEKDKHRLSYKQRESTGEDGGVFVENPIRAYFSSLVNRKKPPPPSSPPPASALANIPPPPPSAPPPPPPDPKTLPRKPEIPNDAPKIQIMNNM